MICAQSQKFETISWHDKLNEWIRISFPLIVLMVLCGEANYKDTYPMACNSSMYISNMDTVSIVRAPLAKKVKDNEHSFLHWYGLAFVEEA